MAYSPPYVRTFWVHLQHVCLLFVLVFFETFYIFTPSGKLHQQPVRCVCHRWVLHGSQHCMLWQTQCTHTQFIKKPIMHLASVFLFLWDTCYYRGGFIPTLCWHSSYILLLAGTQTYSVLLEVIRKMFDHARMEWYVCKMPFLVIIVASEHKLCDIVKVRDWKLKWHVLEFISDILDYPVMSICDFF